MKEVQYPIAFNKAEHPTHISRVDKDDEYTCPACRVRMTPKTGAVRKHHFAHKPVFGHCSDKDAIHAVAQKLIMSRIEHDIHGFKKGNWNLEPLYLQGPCVRADDAMAVLHPTKSHPQAVYYRELSNYMEGGQYTTVKMEARGVIDGRRPDIVITSPQGNKIIIEVVYTHDLDSDARRDYADAGYATFLLDLKDWDDVERLRAQLAMGYISFQRTLNVKHLCNWCMRKEGWLRGDWHAPPQSDWSDDVPDWLHKGSYYRLKDVLPNGECRVCGWRKSECRERTFCHQCMRAQQREENARWKYSISTGKIPNARGLVRSPRARSETSQPYGVLDLPW